MPFFGFFPLYLCYCFFPFGCLDVVASPRLVCCHQKYLSSLYVSAQDAFMHEDQSTFADEVFESPSDATLQDSDLSKQLDESDMTGSALNKSDLERSHLML